VEAVSDPIRVELRRVGVLQVELDHFLEALAGDQVVSQALEADGAEPVGDYNDGAEAFRLADAMKETGEASVREGVVNQEDFAEHDWDHFLQSLRQTVGISFINLIVHKRKRTIISHAVKDR